MKVRAFHSPIFKSPALGDCSKNGISNRYDWVYVMGEKGNIEIDLDKPDEIPDNFVVVSAKVIDNNIYHYFIPYKLKDRSVSFGGAFVYDCDANYIECFGRHPIALHDCID